MLDLDVTKSAGPDNVPGTFLISCAKPLGVPICLLFQRSIEESTKPSIWKRAYLTPVHKKSSKLDISNYSPIPKLCIKRKVLKNTCIISHMHFQWVYLVNVSISNLALLNNYVTDAMSDGYQVDIIYTDYSKAFDRIRHCPSK